eukprot:2045182-Amphidinium_carterae.1
MLQSHMNSRPRSYNVGWEGIASGVCYIDYNNHDNIIIFNKITPVYLALLIMIQHEQCMGLSKTISFALGTRGVEAARPFTSTCLLPFTTVVTPGFGAQPWQSCHELPFLGVRLLDPFLKGDLGTMIAFVPLESYEMSRCSSVNTSDYNTEAMVVLFGVLTLFANN